MDIRYNLIAKSTSQELQNWRQHNVTTLGSGAGLNGAIRYLTTTDGSNVAHNFYGVKNGNYRRFITDGDDLSTFDLSLEQRYLWIGKVGGGISTAHISALRLNEFGAPTANVPMGGYKLTGHGVITGADAADTVATKGYVDTVAQGLDAKGSCLLASNQALPACTYSSGAGTLTANVNGALTNVMVDSAASGVTIALGASFLIKNQASSFQNGIYTLTQVGSAGTPWILTRRADADLVEELLSAFTFIERGSSESTGWVQTSDTYTFSTGTIVWAQFSGAGVYTAGKGLIAVGTEFHFAKSTAYAQGDLFYGITGGSGEAATTKIDILPIAAADRLLRSTGTAPAWTAWTMASPTTGALLRGNGISVAWEAVTPVGNGVLVCDSGGANFSWVTNLPTATTIGGGYIYRANGTDVSLSDGGTGTGLTAVNGGLVWSTATTLAITAAGTSGHFVRSGGAATPTFFDLYGSLGQVYSNAGASSSVLGFKFNADAVPRIQIWQDQIRFGDGSGGVPSCAILWTGLGSQLTLQSNNVSLQTFSGGVPQFRFYDGGTTNYISLKAAASLAGIMEWTLPPTDSTNGVWRSNGSGVLTCAAIAASEIGSGAALSRVNDTNVTLTLGGSPSTSLLAATSLTLGWTGTLALARGGTGANLTGSAGGLPYFGSASAMAVLAAHASSGRHLLSGAAGAPSWSSWALPSTVAANQLLHGSSGTAASALAIVSDRVLTSLGGTLAWAGVLNPPQGAWAGSTVGLARKYCVKTAGNNVNTYIDITHNLGTGDVVVGLRDSAASDSFPREIFFTKIEALNVNTVRVHFSAVQTSSDHFVFTVIG